MNEKTKGAIGVLSASFLFGSTPILGQLSYDGGSNWLMLTLLRAVLSLPMLAVILRLQHIPLGITRRNLRDFLLLGVFGWTTSTMTYYLSFAYISVGLATVINCTYPFFVVLYSAIFLRERMNRASILALVLAMGGVFMFLEPGTDVHILGVIMALVSSIAYAFVLLFQYRSSLSPLPPLKLTFWMCIVTTVVTTPLAVFTDMFTLRLTPMAWMSTFGVAIGASVLALSLTQYGLVRVGSSVAAILTMLQPITSVVMGVLILGEPMSWMKGIGGCSILAAITLLTFATRRSASPAAEPVSDAAPS